MESKIIFLGTAGDKDVVGKQIRASGGIILQTQEHQFHIDPGPGSLVRAKQFGVNLRENTAVLVSHAHINHCNDINAVIDAMTHSGFDKKGLLVCNKTVYNGNQDFEPYVTRYHKSCLEKNIVMEEGQKLGVDNIEIHALPTRHMDVNGIGFKIFTPKFVLSYSSDTGFTNELIEAYKDTDILILNVKNPSGVHEEGHLNTDDAIKIIEKVKPSLLIITHFGLKMLKADPIYEARRIQQKTGTQTITAKDGMIVEPSSYSARSKQKRLNVY